MSDPLSKLKARVDKNRAERARDQLRTKRYDERMAEINSAADGIKVDFWCGDCRLDCKVVGHKQVRFKTRMLPWAWYIGYCPEGHQVIRRITEKWNDPYYRDSELLQRQRWELRDELLQPSDPRFKLVYPAEWRKMQEEKERQELINQNL